MSSNAFGFQTIDELVNWTYNQTPDQIMKASNGYNTGTSGVYNPLYGAAVWANFNLEANLFSALPKYVWDFSGWRIFTDKAPVLADAGTDNNNSLGGTDEGGLIATSIFPPVLEVNVKPKTLQYPFEASEVLEQLVDNSRDDNYGSLAQQRVYAADQFKERVNLQLAYRPIDNDSTAEENTTGFNIESLVRIVSDRAETDFVDTATSTLANGAMNVWNYTGGTVIDRTTGTGVNTLNANVRSASGVLGTPDVLTDSLIRKQLSDVRIAAGKEPTFMIGGQDTYSEVQSIYMAAYRIQNTADLRTEMSVGVNGVKTFTGTGAGLHISSVYGLPYIPTKDAPGDSGDVGDLLILNTSSDKAAPGKPLLGIQVLKPTVYYEASKRQQGWPFINGSFNDKALYEMLAETTCRNFKAQGKIRDILSGI